MTAIIRPVKNRERERLEEKQSGLIWSLIRYGRKKVSS